MTTQSAWTQVGRTRLGRTEMNVSRIAFGTWQLGGDWGATDEQAAIGAIRHAYDRGINFFDTAQGYGFGASEPLLAKAIHGLPRESVVIATAGWRARRARRERCVDPSGCRRQPPSARNRVHRSAPDAFAGPQDAVRGDGGRTRRSGLRRQGSSRGCLQLRSAADGRLAVAWALARPAVNVAIIGTRNAEHVDDAVAAAGLDLSADVLRRVDEIAHDAVRIAGPRPEAM